MSEKKQWAVLCLGYVNKQIIVNMETRQKREHLNNCVVQEQESMCILRNKSNSKYQESKKGIIQNRMKRNVRKTMLAKILIDTKKMNTSMNQSNTLKIRESRGSEYNLDVEMKVQPDSGTDVNVMDEQHFKNLRKLSRNTLRLERSRTEFKTLQNS